MLAIIFWEEDMTLKTFLLGACSALAFAGMASAETLTIATVNNGDMIRMQKLTDDFTKKNPDIHLELGDARRERAARARHHRHRHQGRPVRRPDHRHLRSADLGQAGLAAAARQPRRKDYDADDLLPAIRSGLPSTASSMPRRSTAKARWSCTARTCSKRPG
jgi:sorbitol/mannitol transport system substrate-binding protein